MYFSPIALHCWVKICRQNIDGRGGEQGGTPPLERKKVTPPSTPKGTPPPQVSKGDPPLKLAKFYLPYYISTWVSRRKKPSSKFFFGRLAPAMVLN